MTTSIGGHHYAYEKTQATVYTIHRQKNEHSWGVFTLHDSGLLQICSDYGNYQYWWTSRGEGCDLAHFLIQCDEGYLLDKFSYPENGGEHFFADETVESIKKDICRYRRKEELTKEEARDAWEDLSDLEDFRTGEGFFQRLMGHDSIMKVYGDDPCQVPSVKGPSYQLRALMKRLWPPFIEILKKECGYGKA